MPLEGGTAQDIVINARKAVRPAMMQMLRDNVDYLVDIVIMNTPVDTRNARTSVYQMDVMRYRLNGQWVYQSGAATDVWYMRLLEDGTGIYGPRKKRITSRTPGKPMTWIDRETGKRMFAMSIAGMPASHMFAIGAAMTEHEFERNCAKGLALYKTLVEVGE